VFTWGAIGWKILPTPPTGVSTVPAIGLQSTVRIVSDEVEAVLEVVIDERLDQSVVVEPPCLLPDSAQTLLTSTL
jgi:hypothetical protein